MKSFTFAEAGTKRVYRATDDGFVELTGFALAMFRMRIKLRDWTRWWRPRVVVAAIDRDAGRITMRKERWSWRRWRWEAVT